MWFESARWIRKRGSCSWLNNLGQQIGWQNVRRSEAIFNIALQFGLPLAAIALGCLLWFLAAVPVNYVIIMLLLLSFGFFMFLKAKLSVIRQGRLLSFGSGGMSRTNRTFYFLGYAVMAIALLLSLVLLGFYRLL